MLGTIGAAGIAAAIILIYALPRIINEAEIIQAKKNEFADIEEKRVKIKEVKASIDENQAGLRGIEAVIVDGTEPLNFIEAIYATASLSEISIKSLGLIGSVTGDKKPAFIPFVSISAEGRENGLTRFIKLVELLPFELEVESFGIKGDRLEGDSTLNMDLSVLVK